MASTAANALFICTVQSSIQGWCHLLGRMVVALVGGMQALVAGAHHQRGDLQHGAAIRS